MDNKEKLDKFKKLAEQKKELDEKSSSIKDEEKWLRPDNPWIWCPVYKDDLED